MLTQELGLRGARPTELNVAPCSLPRWAVEPAAMLAAVLQGSCETSSCRSRGRLSGHLKVTSNRQQYEGEGLGIKQNTRML